MRNTKTFVKQVGDWDVSPMFGISMSWRTDLKRFISDSDKIVEAIKYNKKLAKKLLKMSRKEQEAYWEKYG